MLVFWPRRGVVIDGSVPILGEFTHMRWVALATRNLTGLSVLRSPRRSVGTTTLEGLFHGPTGRSEQRHLFMYSVAMRSDIVPGATFPDYELSDHTAKRRKLSELQGPDPMVPVLHRGAFCPKD